MSAIASGQDRAAALQKPPQHARSVVARLASRDLQGHQELRRRLAYLFNSRSYRAAAQYGEAMRRFAATGQPEPILFGDLQSAPETWLSPELLRDLRRRALGSGSLSGNDLIVRSYLQLGEPQPALEILRTELERDLTKILGEDWEEQVRAGKKFPDLEHLVQRCYSEIWTLHQFGYVAVAKEFLERLAPLEKARVVQSEDFFWIYLEILQTAAASDSTAHQVAIGRLRKFIDDREQLAANDEALMRSVVSPPDLQEQPPESRRMMEEYYRQNAALLFAQQRESLRSGNVGYELLLAPLTKDWRHVPAGLAHRQKNSDGWRRTVGGAFGWADDTALPSYTYNMNAYSIEANQLTPQYAMLALTESPFHSQSLQWIAADRLLKAESIHRFAARDRSPAAQRLQGVASAYRHRVYEDRVRPAVQLCVDWLSDEVATTDSSHQSSIRTQQSLNGIEAPALDSLPDVTVPALQYRLADDEAFIEVLCGRPFDTATDRLGIQYLPPRYIAWMVRKQGEPMFVDLGAASELDALVRTARSALADAVATIADVGEQDAAAQADRALAPLARRLLHPFAEHLQGIEHLMICPDGELWLTPWAALPLPSGEPLIERCAVSLKFTSAELLLDEQQHPVGAGQPVVFTNARFDARPDEILAVESQFLGGWKSDRDIFLGSEDHSIPDEILAKLAPAEVPFSPAMDGTRLFPSVSPLPGTAREAHQIQPALRSLTKKEPAIYSGTQACEAILQAIVRPKYLIIQSHGFYLPPPEASADTSASDGDGSFHYEHWPAHHQPLDMARDFARCGLLLAGANQSDAWSEARSADGVVSALEVALMDLRNTEMVVLSACDTGVGDVRTGEGVASLCQAFQMAGAQSVVSTLWQVADQSTADIMADFFQNLDRGQPRHIALRNAQRAHIAQRTERFGSAHPFFWAPFTLNGSIGPLRK